MNIRLATKAAHRYNTFYVTSDTDANVEYTVHNRRNLVGHRKTWTCNCRDFTERQIVKNGTCKHIDHVRYCQDSGLPPFIKFAADPTYCRAIPIGASARQLLDAVVAKLNENTTESEDLWMILSAFRGPDSSDGLLKDGTTARLRAMVGLKSIYGVIVEDANPLGLDELKAARVNNNDNPRIVVVKVVENAYPTDRVSSHFARHYARGLDAALNLGYSYTEK